MRLIRRLMLPLVLVVALAAPIAADAETAPPDRRAFIQVVTPTLVYAGHPFTFAGRLVSAVARLSPTSNLHVVRTIEGVNTAFPDVVTSEDGAFTFGDSYNKAGPPAYYRFSWDGDDAHDPTSRTFVVLIRPVPVTFTFQVAPASPTALDSVTISGALSFGAGEQVSSPVDLTVQRRPNGSLSGVDLPPVTTEPDGTFEFSDFPHGGLWSYAVTFAGDDAHERRTSGTTVDVRFLHAQVSVESADGEPARWGQESRYVGRVTALEGPAVSSPLPIFAQATGTCGWSSEAYATTAPDGTFEFSILPACPHDSELEVQSGRAGDLGSARTTLMPVSVAKGPSSVNIDYSLPTGSSTTDWLTPTSIQAWVWPWAAGKGLMDVYAQPYGKAKVRMLHVWVTGGDNPGFTYHADRRTVITAVYGGDEGLLPSSRTSVLSVRPYMHQQIQYAYRAADGWKVYHLRTNPHISANITPAHPGKSLRIVVQRYVNGGWRAEVARSVTLDRDGFIDTDYRGHRAIGAKFRVQTKWAGDVDHAPVSSGWRYFRFTT